MPVPHREGYHPVVSDIMDFCESSFGRESIFSEEGEIGCESDGFTMRYDAEDEEVLVRNGSIGFFREGLIKTEKEFNPDALEFIFKDGKLIVGEGGQIVESNEEP